MSENYDDNEFGDDDQGNGPAGLRKVAEDRKKALASAEKELAELRKFKAEQQVGEVLNERGIKDTRAKELLTTSGVDLSKPEAVDGWLGKYGDLFGYQRQAEVSAETQADAAAIQQMNRAESGGIPDNQHDNVLAQIRAASPDELPALLAKLAPQVKATI